MDMQSSSSSSSDLSNTRNRIPDYLLDTPICQAKKKMKLAKDQTGTMPIQLPTHWNPKDKCSLLELSKGNLRVSYQGTGGNESDAAAVRANHPMPYQCGLFYFEVTIINKGQKGYIGIGFCTSSVDLKKLPGWENYSWGYHGDDGHSFCFSGSGKAYGPTFTTKDTIGCCINFMDMTVFYTKNGVNLGIAFRDIKNDYLYYPAIGLRTPGEVVEANFGQKKFKFDIENCIKEEKAKLWHYINSIDLPILTSNYSEMSNNMDLPILTSNYSETSNNNNKSSNGLNELVLQYLVHHGYSETAQTFYNNAFAKNDKVIKQKEENNMEECDVVGAGGLSGIAKYNEVFDMESLKNRQRIKEYVMKGDIDSAIDLTNSLYPTVLANNDILLFNLRCRKFIEMIRKNEELDMDTEVDTIDDDAMDVDDDKNKNMNQRIVETMKYGQELNNLYGQDERDEIKNTLTKTFSLFAYEHPNNSALSYLLDPSRREIVANQLNVAILESQGEPASPAIETLYRQSAVAVKELVKNNVGSAAFINVKKDCLM